MASSIFHKLLKIHQIPTKFTSILHKTKNPFIIPPLSSNPLLLDQTLPPNQSNPNLDQLPAPNSIFPNSLPIFPSFPFGYCLNPVLSTGSSPDFGSAAGEGVTGEDDGMWADSVKKKRKKKMNKHKLKKLRKRLRRKT